MLLHHLITLVYDLADLAKNVKKMSIIIIVKLSKMNYFNIIFKNV